MAHDKWGKLSPEERNYVAQRLLSLFPNRERSNLSPRMQIFVTVLIWLAIVFVCVLLWKVISIGDKRRSRQGAPLPTPPSYRLYNEHFQRGHINTLDKLQSIHQIENADPAESGCVSLHVYSLPIESCVAFDLEQQRCCRRTLSYYSRYGKVEIDLPHPLQPTLIKPAV